jgi:hypothetical protein
MFHIPYVIAKLFVISMVLFLAGIKAREMKEEGRLTWFWATVGYPVALAFIVLDAVILNMIVGTLVYREIPQWTKGEYMFSGRTQRLYDKGNPVARFFAIQIDKVAPDHIHLRPEDVGK